ncbi:MAG: hypothetical protein A2583_12530 [Bdellovibrionales bacterium RIFOXYD1_FULL_53_11]|nr:MAG: hypothetical protein A2583_12530 [Bdellovibrionales bacterium RIFOXYD1_FULL_53_11]
MKILFIENQPCVSSLLKLHLENVAGNTVISAGSVEQAAAILDKDRRWDVLVSGLYFSETMPHYRRRALTGADLIDMVLESKLDIPNVILLTSVEQDEPVITELQKKHGHQFKYMSSADLRGFFDYVKGLSKNCQSAEVIPLPFSSGLRVDVGGPHTDEAATL